MENSRSLRALLGQRAYEHVGDLDVAVAGVAYDSRRVEPGFVFVAVRGFVHDGLDFVGEAIARGAVAVVAESRLDPAELNVSVTVQIESARSTLAGLAAAWYHEPSESLQVAGITGTNGKTTVTALLEDMFAENSPSGRWSTTQVSIAGRSAPTPRTTPEALELQAALAEMLEADCAQVVIEVSSHAQRLQRTAGTRFASATFTNLSPDHLDFHADMDDYFDAKSTLFSTLDADALAIINYSDPRGAALAQLSTGRVVGYGWADTEAEYRMTTFDSAPSGSRLVITTPAGDLELATPLFGRANAENLAAAVATALELGSGREHVTKVVADFLGEPGRLQPIDAGQPFSVLVDFAHTPGALEAALEAARSIASEGRVISVFGCGGDRHQGKRPMMGRIAAEASDLTIVTSDNPRGEAPEAIADAIVEGITPADLGHVRVELDRAAAIRLAIAEAAQGDCVLIAGKGHETAQIFADRTVPFDDARVAMQSLRQLGVAE
ncbi:MAG: UDP-N-acetylmuramoyl-L-alanyl-D-glutamate--2,6-diaminopimelate ligase [Acidobacteria bacterium]|nr:UDP-N-acetylmuramoyl-L-alanyl-D-glutamate--2,6-diaminopimelate ligase [Acidobacteriota bacterium]